MGIGGADRDRDRQTCPFGDEVDLRAVLAAIDRIRTCQVAHVTARTLTESIAHRDQSSSPRAPSSSSRSRYSLTRIRAVVHSVKQRCTSARRTEGRRQLPPRTPAGGHVHDHRQDPPVVHPRPPATLWRCRRRRTTRWNNSQTSLGTSGRRNASTTDLTINLKRVAVKAGCTATLTPDSPTVSAS